MTCVAFQAVREYIVGKTAPVPVKIYDYYEPGVPLMNLISSFSCYRPGKPHSVLTFVNICKFWIFLPSYDECHRCLVCLDVWLSCCGSGLAMQLLRPPGSTMLARAVPLHESCVTDLLAMRWRVQPISGQVGHICYAHHTLQTPLYQQYPKKDDLPAGFVQANQCNNVFGCLEEEQFERCTCYRDCGYDGEPVCGSDGQLYQNQCQMEVFACRNGTRIKQVPPSQCPHSKSSLITRH